MEKKNKDKIASWQNLIFIESPQIEREHNFIKMIEKCVYMPFTYLFSKTVMAAGAHMCICMCVGRRGKVGMGMV